MGHYTAFFCSSKDLKQWFYANDAEVMQVSVATVLQQEPFLAFYRLRKDERPHALSINSCYSILWQSYLTDQVCTIHNFHACTGGIIRGSGLMWSILDKVKGTSPAAIFPLHTT
ncbi:uncharacterized protein [Dysidea avara]|uniref:uncharacterized protein n=1 Tax=Dysidea avara TaxID=196820 RepID=UPI00332986F0